MGIAEFSAFRGYETPDTHEFSDEAMCMGRMCTEPSCTPTGVTLMTGRLHVHTGMGDIAESRAMNNGFDYAQMAVQQQRRPTIFNDDAIFEDVSVAIDDYVPAYTIDSNFRPKASAMMTTIEGEAGGPIYDIRMEPGERGNAQKYVEMEKAYRDKAMAELARLAGREEPFFLLYWPLLPLDNMRAGRDGISGLMSDGDLPTEYQGQK